MSHQPDRPQLGKQRPLLLTPRWLALAALTLAFVVAAIFLGRWQWQRTQTILEAERAAASQPVPIEQLLPTGTAQLPDEIIGHPVTLSGSFEPDMQVAVTNRELNGQPGVWVVTGLRLADGRVVAVLRGWATGTDDPVLMVPPEKVTITGVLQPNEGFYADAATAPGTVASISSDRLATTWNTALLPGYVTLQLEEPPRNAAPAPVPATVRTDNVAFPLQNFFYAFQWWIFGIFAVVIFARWLYLDTRRDAEGEPTPPTTVDP